MKTFKKLNAKEIEKVEKKNIQTDRVVYDIAELKKRKVEIENELADINETLSYE
jgi:hypothetical protein